MPLSPMFILTGIFCRYFTESCKIFTAYATLTDIIFFVGDLPLEIQTEVFRWYISFFLRTFSVCKIIGFCLPTELGTESVITDKHYFDGCFPLGK